MWALSPQAAARVYSVLSMLFKNIYSSNLAQNLLPKCGYADHQRCEAHLPGRAHSVAHSKAVHQMLICQWAIPATCKGNGTVGLPATVRFQRLTGPGGADSRLGNFRKEGMLKRCHRGVTTSGRFGSVLDRFSWILSISQSSNPICTRRGSLRLCQLPANQSYLQSL